MDEPEPLPAFTFSPDGPATITYPDGTVSVNAERPGDAEVIPATASDEPMSATPPAGAPSPAFPAEAPEDSQPAVAVADPAPSGDSVMPGSSTSVAEAGAPADVPGASEPQTLGAAPAGEPEAAEPQAAGTAPVMAPATTLQARGALTATADADASGSVLNPDGTITTRLPD